MKVIKRFLLTAVLAVLISAQGVYAQKLELGVKAGMNISSLSGLADVDYQSFLGSVSKGVLPAFHAGFVAEYHATNNISVAPELLYSFQGGKVNLKSNVGDSDGNVTFKAHYVNIPIMVKFYPISRVALEFGPQIGFNIVGSLNIDGESSVNKDALNVFDFGLGVGANVRLLAGLNAGIRYVHGFTNAMKNVQVENLVNEEINSKNRTFQIYLGFMF
ncbi:MAG: porin family protein [Bacteroidales bacterium]